MKIIQSNQNGAVLFVGLMMLLIMSLIAVTGMQGATLEERMAGNARDSLVALQTAEAALQAGEAFLDNNVINLPDFDTDGTDGLYNNVNDELWKSLSWDATDSRNYAGFNPGNVNTPPRYVIQHISATQAAPNLLVENYGEGQASQTIQLFRVTARGTGGRDNTEVIVQSIYGAN
ncbi:MAG: PilX N-terminal domain-containing pilus assembly protein [Gammaproteobacteria bacterium]